MKSADLYRLFELATEFSATEFVRDHDAEHGDGIHLTLRAEAHDVGQMAARAIEAQAGADAFAALQAETVPAAQPWVPMCTPCLMEAKQAQLRGGPVPEVNGVATFANGVGICEIRHQIQVEPPKLLLAQPGQVPAFGG